MIWALLIFLSLLSSGPLYSVLKPILDLSQSLKCHTSVSKTHHAFSYLECSYIWNICWTINSLKCFFFFFIRYNRKTWTNFLTQPNTSLLSFYLDKLFSSFRSSLKNYFLKEYFSIDFYAPRVSLFSWI